MKLIASLITHNEANRFLKLCIESLLGFCDEIRVLEDDSTDGTHKILSEMKAKVLRNDYRMFFEHEGRARQKLLEWTMEGNPTHILAIDADEFVADGQLLRAELEKPVEALTMSERRRRSPRMTPVGVWSLQMQEIWGATDDVLNIRQDGGWKEHPVPIVFTVPPPEDREALRHWQIPDRALACGRVPKEVGFRAGRLRERPVTQILHYGWACKKDRAARHARYVEHDGGKHHAGSHLNSIMCSDNRVRMTEREWPESLAAAKAGLLARINQ